MRRGGIRGKEGRKEWKGSGRGGGGERDEGMSDRGGREKERKKKDGEKQTGIDDGEKTTIFHYERKKREEMKRALTSFDKSTVSP